MAFSSSIEELVLFLWKLCLVSQDLISKLCCKPPLKNLLIKFVLLQLFGRSVRRKENSARWHEEVNKGSSFQSKHCLEPMTFSKLRDNNESCLIISEVPSSNTEETLKENLPWQITFDMYIWTSEHTQAPECLIFSCSFHY